MSYEGIIRGSDGRFTAGSRLGAISPSSAPKSHPTTQEVCWAAGIYEGEGSCYCPAGSERASVAQKDLWLLFKLQDLFGGTVRQRQGKGLPAIIDGKKYPRIGGDWYINGARARGFLMTIYKFLSPRRQEQIRKALGKSPFKEEATQVA